MLKFKSVSPVAFFIFSEMILSIQDPLRFSMNFRMAFSVSTKKKYHWDFDRDCIETVDCFEEQLFSRSVMSHYSWPDGLQHARLPCPSPSPGVWSNSCPLSQWCYPTILSSDAPFFYLQSFPASGSFPMSWLSASGGQSIGAPASIIPVNIQSWFPLGLTALISLQSKGLSRVFSSTTVWKHQFFSAQPSSHLGPWNPFPKWFTFTQAVVSGTAKLMISVIL